MKAEIFSKQQLIGIADLGIGDYTMGGLYGEFVPNKLYLDEIQSRIREANSTGNYKLMQLLDIRFRFEDQYIPYLGGVVIYDYEELSDEPIRIEFAGIACDLIDHYYNIGNFF